jgi:hypothetical protein
VTTRADLDRVAAWLVSDTGTVSDTSSK